MAFARVLCFSQRHDEKSFSQRHNDDEKSFSQRHDDTTKKVSHNDTTTRRYDEKSFSQRHNDTTVRRKKFLTTTQRISNFDLSQVETKNTHKSPINHTSCTVVSSCRCEKQKAHTKAQSTTPAVPLCRRVVVRNKKHTQKPNQSHQLYRRVVVSL